MMSWLLMLMNLAHAEGMHTGIAIKGVEGLGEVSFQTSTTGWTAPVEDGFVRVYVATDEEKAKDWVERMRESMARFKPQANPDFVANSLADEAYGDGQGLLIFRDGNVGVQVRNKKDAVVWAEILQMAISDDPSPWPTGADLVPGDGTWTVQSPEGTVHTTFEGGRLARHQGMVFTTPPRALIVWDSWGRATRTEFSDVNP